MNPAEQETRLQGIKDTMAELQRLSARLCEYVWELEKTGMKLPAMRQTAETLAQVSLGWKVGEQ